MGENDKRSKKPLTDRIKDRLRDLVDELVEVIEGMTQPPMVPIPVRRPR